MAYGSVEVDLGYDVVILNFDHGPPVFHAPADEFDIERDEEGDVVYWRTKTRCGETLYSEANERESERRGTSLPARYAVKFGRPCATCWPRLRAQPSLFQRTRLPEPVHTQTDIDFVGGVRGRPGD